MSRLFEREIHIQFVARARDTRVLLCEYIYKYTCIRVFMCVCKCICIWICICICIFVYTCIYTCIYHVVRRQKRPISVKRDLLTMPCIYHVVRRLKRGCGGWYKHMVHTSTSSSSFVLAAALALAVWNAGVEEEMVFAGEGPWAFVLLFFTWDLI